jgi:beta-phosphoglucomutase-like phosphatase (HAD superfamily)
MNPLDALVFDVDGTLADTEEVHRQAFNAAFQAHGLEWRWTAGLYRELLVVPGGKERLRHHVDTLGLPVQEAEWLKGLVPLLHATKTRIFAELVQAGRVRPRPGIIRLLGEARAAGLRLAIASTTSLANVEALLPNVLGEEAPGWFHVVATGDVVPHKKPEPDIYLLALQQLGCPPERCVAFEDSAPGVRAAKGAGLFTVATPTHWSEGHDLAEADLVVPSLGDPQEPLDPATAGALGGRWVDLPMLGRLRSAPSVAGAMG